MRKRAIAATMLLTAAMAFTSCAKLYEEETTETLKRPQTDIEIPEDNPWDEVPDSDLRGCAHCRAVRQG